MVQWTCIFYKYTKIEPAKKTFAVNVCYVVDKKTILLHQDKQNMPYNKTQIWMYVVHYELIGCNLLPGYRLTENRLLVFVKILGYTVCGHNTIHKRLS